MPTIDTLIQSQFAQRRGVEPRVLFWIEPRNRATGLREALGLSNLDDHRDFDVEGETRTFYGAGNVLGLSPIRSVTGLDVMYHSITLPPFTDEVRLILDQYDAHLAPVRVYSVALDIDTMKPLAAPIRFVKGTLQEAPKTVGAKRTASSKVALKMASNVRRLTLSLPIYRSQDALERRSAGDLGREHIGVAPDWVVPWGEE